MSDTKISDDPRITPTVDDVLAAVNSPDSSPSNAGIAISELFGLLYPVGSIYISTLATNPGTLLGVGTWAAFGAGKTLVSLDSGQTEFDTVEETGGEKTHTLTTAEMPAHTHTYDHAPDGGASANFGANYVVGGPQTRTTSSTGGDGAHNNLQPYIVVYMWKRTA